MFNTDEKIVLASQSPRRLQILRQVGIEPIVRPVDIEESAPAGLRDICDTPMLLAKAKMHAAEINDGEIVIAADTVVISPDNEILGKPQDRADAERMLRALSGREHRVVTGFAIKDNITKISDRVVTRVIMDEIEEQDLQSYLDTNEPYDKAGAYAIQGLGAEFVSGIDGDYYNVMGLPINIILKVLNIYFRPGRYGKTAE